jgi:hypothetical protein
MICLGGYLWLSRYAMRVRPDREQQKIEPSLFETLQAENSQLQSELRTMQQKVASLRKEKISIKERDDENQANWQMQHNAMLGQKKALTQGIQELSKRHLIEK